MSHLPILPMLVPFVAGAVLMLLHGRGLKAERAVSLASIIALCLIAVVGLSAAADGSIRVYRLGDWPAPFGIVLVHDRLAALMVALTSGLALAVALAATSGADAQGRHFHTFLQLQLAGLNGAFLTGDLFNLFVFFEILLLASYALLAHGGGLERARSGLGYVVLNLAGSALFLIALGLIYGTLGTLNTADLTLVLPQVPVQDQALARTAFALLAAVFLLKAALIPLGFWLPHVYTAATMPVAVLFVVMTKVGIYALMRVSTLGLASAPFTSDLLQPWLPWLAIATIALGTLGALAAQRLAQVVANLVLISSGTLLLGVADGSPAALAASLFYLTHTTIVAAALYVLADVTSRERGALGDSLKKSTRLKHPARLGTAYLVLAVAACGAPPLSGFLAKLMVMRSLQDSASATASWTALLVSGLILALVLARAASVLFWEPGKTDEAVSTGPLVPAPRGVLAALMLLLAGSILVAAAASPISAYARATAEQLSSRAGYVEAILGPEPRILRESRP